MRVYFLGEADGFLDGFPGLAGQTENEGAMDGDAKFPAVLGETLGDVDAHALFDVVQNLLVSGLIAHQQKPQAIILQNFERLAGYVGFRVAGPDDVQLAKLAGNVLGPGGIVGKGIVVEEDFFGLGEVRLRPSDLLYHIADTARAVAVSADRLRPKTKGAARLAAPARVKGQIGELQITYEIFRDIEIPLIDWRDKGKLVHVLENGPVLIVHDFAVRFPVGKAQNRPPVDAFGQLLDG